MTANSSLTAVTYISPVPAPPVGRVMMSDIGRASPGRSLVPTLNPTGIGGEAPASQRMQWAGSGLDLSSDRLLAVVGRVYLGISKAAVSDRSAGRGAAGGQVLPRTADASGYEEDESGPVEIWGAPGTSRRRVDRPRK